MIHKIKVLGKKWFEWNLLFIKWSCFAAINMACWVLVLNVRAGGIKLNPVGTYYIVAKVVNILSVRKGWQNEK